MSCYSIGGMIVVNLRHVVVRMFCQPSDCCGLDLNMAGVGHDISGSHWIAVDET